MRRLAPLLIIVALLFILLPLLRGSKGNGHSSSDRSKRTQHALALIDKAELAYLADHHRYTDRLADLVRTSKGLVPDLAIVSVHLETSSNGTTYIAQVASDVLSLARSRTGTKISGTGCLVLKSGTGFKCPVKKTS
jgi:hypothetical protein